MVLIYRPGYWKCTDLEMSVRASLTRVLLGLIAMQLLVRLEIDPLGFYTHASDATPPQNNTAFDLSPSGITAPEFHPTTVLAAFARPFGSFRPSRREQV